MTITCVSGIDPTPSAMLAQPATPDITGLMVQQLLTGGVRGVAYELRAISSTTDPNLILERVGRIYIE